MNKGEYIIFILTHGRPDKVKTYTTLRRQGYTGQIRLIVDNEDKTINEYKNIFGSDVVVFDKRIIAKQMDAMNNFNDMRAVVYARNACWGIAGKLGYKYYWQFDDDYNQFVYKFNNSKTLEYGEKPIKSLDKLFAAMLRYYKNINALSIAMSQNGDFIGGKNSGKFKDGCIDIMRKVMNTWLCNTDKPFKFSGNMNEDITASLIEGMRGRLMMTITTAAIIQEATQKAKGGMTELYNESGTYIKSFYTVMMAPSCTKVSIMGDKHQRLHHRISWNNAVPKIIEEKYKK